MFSKPLLTIFCTSFIMKGVFSSAIELQNRQVNTLTYTGCLSDPDLNFRTLMYAAGRDSTMTPEKCYGLCGNLKKYRYFGLENGNECWCDYSIKTYATGGRPSIQESKCNMLCEGNAPGSTARCGGAKAISVYENDLVPEPVDKLVVSATGPNSTTVLWEYRNCYMDLKNNVRVLQLPVQPAQGVTPETCTTTCGLMGYTLAGLEWGHECWCGNSLNYSVTSADDPKVLCKQACEKDTTVNCGYIGLASVYAKKVVPL
ncbi:WSC domain-containing protein [Panaeolus papilionaceus]|nr:WSC domain-containing protein [Panaeolus papilionaceus]